MKSLIFSEKSEKSVNYRLNSYLKMPIIMVILYKERKVREKK